MEFQAEKKSVRLNANTCKLCYQMTYGNDTNWSSSLNDMAEQYLLMIQENTVEITNNQKLALQCLYNGYAPSPDLEREISLLPWHISEGYKYDDQVTDFLGSEEEATQFILQVEKWTKSQKLAAIFHAKAAWKQS